MVGSPNLQTNPEDIGPPSDTASRPSLSAGCHRTHIDIYISTHGFKIHRDHPRIALMHPRLWCILRRSPHIVELLYPELGFQCFPRSGTSSWLEVTRESGPSRHRTCRLTSFVHTVGQLISRSSWSRYTPCASSTCSINVLLHVSRGRVLMLVREIKVVRRRTDRLFCFMNHNFVVSGIRRKDD
jgi:hypothetical protein